MYRNCTSYENSGPDWSKHWVSDITKSLICGWQLYHQTVGVGLRGSFCTHIRVQVYPYVVDSNDVSTSDKVKKLPQFFTTTCMHKFLEVAYMSIPGGIGHNKTDDFFGGKLFHLIK